jgi:uncharacterized protein
MNVAGTDILEIKRTLDGREQRFDCTLLQRTPDWVAVRYVLSAPAVVGTLVLPAGTETIAHYWPDRPYTAYHWFDAGGRPLGVYLNAAADVVLGADAIRWLDMALDVLVTAKGGVELLDDDEARAAPDWAQPAIHGARAHLLTHAAMIAAEVTRLSAFAREGRAVGQRK